jgi:hypothetical protein
MEVRSPRCAARLSTWHLVLPCLVLLTWFATQSEPVLAATSVVVLAPGQVAEAASTMGAGSTVPADGRLRGPDFTAVVTRVVWPQSVPSPSGSSYVAGTGRRLVAFTFSVTQATVNAGVGNAPSGVSAKVTVGATSAPISMSAINQQIAAGASGSTQTTGTDSFVASVPARASDVALTLSEGGFSQSLDLWTLKRRPPSPVVLYRAPNSSTVTGTAAGSFHLGFTNTADGFSSSDDGQVSSATLTYFAPGNSDSTPAQPAQAFLVLGIQSSYPNVPYGQPNSGHFFSSFSPLPGNLLAFTPTGRSAVTATADTTDFSSVDAASDDDGLFDALYTFTVPATTTGGTFGITPGQISGTEYTGFTGSGTSVPITITRPATVDLSFPAVPAQPAAQKKPPWVGAPLPSTGLAAAGATNNGTGTSSGGFPIWLAVLLLVLVAAAVVVVQRVRRRTAPAFAVPSAAAPSSGSATTEASPVDTAHGSTDTVVPLAPVSVGSETERADRSMALNFMGWRQFVGFRAEGGSPSVEALATYLVCHDMHHLSADQIALGMWPLGRRRGEVSRKTIHNNLSQLRSWVGVEHLPDAAVAGGYLLEGIDSDWATFSRLAREADTVGDDAARALRIEALELVRGRPFEGLSGDGYDWVDEEGLIGNVTKAIVTCARRLGTHLMEAAEFNAAEDAARAGLRGAPNEHVLWELGARAIWARGDRTALETWLAEAGRHLDSADVERIRRALGHEDSPES